MGIFYICTLGLRWDLVPENMEAVIREGRRVCGVRYSSRGVATFPSGIMVSSRNVWSLVQVQR